MWPKHSGHEHQYATFTAMRLHYGNTVINNKNKNKTIKDQHQQHNLGKTGDKTDREEQKQVTTIKARLLNCFMLAEKKKKRKEM